MDLKQQLLLLFFGALFFLLFSIVAARSYPPQKSEDQKVVTSSTTSIPTPAQTTTADNSTKSTPGVTRPSKIKSGRRTTRKPSSSKSPKIILPNFRHQDDTDKRLVSLQTVYDPVRGQPVVVFVDGSGRLLIDDEENDEDNEVDDKKEEVHLQPSHMKVVGDEWEQLPGSFNFDDYLFFVGEDGNGGGDGGGNLGGDNGEDDNGGGGGDNEEEEEEGDRNDEEDWSVANYYDGEYGDGDYSGTLDGEGDEGTF